MQDMSALKAALLGIVQGLTEFLPVSSSGHLVIFQRLFGLSEPALVFDISLHVGTLAAVLILYRRDIGAILAALARQFQDLFQGKSSLKIALADAQIRLALMIIIGSVPTAIIGLVLEKFTDRLFGSVLMVGIMLIVTGTFLWATRKAPNQEQGTDTSWLRNALIIGTIQGLAVIPGISRSGATISAALFLGMRRDLAARYSFLLSVPAILGAEILHLGDLTAAGMVPQAALLVGVATAFGVGCTALMALLKLVDRGRIYVFAPYCWIAGALAVLYHFWV